MDCEACEARIATVNNDAELRQRVAKEWSELNGVEITPEMINCAGCRIDGGEDALLRIALSDPSVRHEPGPGDLRRLRGNGAL